MNMRRRDKDRRSIAVAQALDDFDRLGIVRVQYIETDLDSGEDEDDEDEADEQARRLARNGHRASTIAYVKRLRAQYHILGTVRLDYEMLTDESGDIDPSEWIQSCFDDDRFPLEVLENFKAKARGVLPQAMRLERLVTEQIDDGESDGLFKVGAVIEVTAIDRGEGMQSLIDPR